MLGEIIRELIKTKESAPVTSELVRAKTVEDQRAQSTIITSLSKTKEFDKIKKIKDGQRQAEKTSNMCQNACVAELQFLWFQPYTWTMPGLCEDVWQNTAR